jgi:hypothetical protein
MKLIKVKPYSPDHTDYVLMEETSFIKGVHELYEEDEAPNKSEQSKKPKHK